MPARREQDPKAERVLVIAPTERDAEAIQVAVLAHDLRTPLQAIWFTAAELGKGEPGAATVKKSAERIARAADRMARMIGDLLDFTRIRHGHGIPITPEEADLDVVARRAVEEAQAAHPGRRIALARRGDVRGVWDADRIAQVASNLVGNAVAYSRPDTEVRVSVSGGEDEVALEVHNQGDPIPPDTMATLFDPFKRGVARGDGEQARRGLGLGLFIADRIARAHGGAIHVASTALTGTTFTVTLPRRAAPAEHEAERPADRAAPPAAERGDPRRHRVMVVEDDEGIRETFCQTLTDEGYHVVSAADGREALDLLSTGERPCVILLDLMMPVMNGWELLDALRQSGELDRLPVVVVSAMESGRPLPPGVQRYVPKPIHLDTLLAAVAESCARLTTAPRGAVAGPRRDDRVESRG